MDSTSHEPQPPRAPRPCSTPHSAPVAWLAGTADPHVSSDPEQSPDRDSPANLTPGDNAPFTPELKARFCEALAQSGMITVACRAVGKHRDTIYEHLQTDPLFAAALNASRLQARHRLADRLMEDSIEGSVDRVYRDGVLVGERRYADNRLAFAMLRRLDRLAEEQRAAARAPSKTFDAKLALKALRTGAEEDLCAALATLESDTSDNPPFQAPAIEDVSESAFGSDRVWQEEEEDGAWWTNFPPPQGFTGYEKGHWSDDDYARECTDDECALLDAARQAELSDLKLAEEEERNSFFADLGAELDAIRHPAPSSSFPLKREPSSEGIASDSCDAAKAASETGWFPLPGE